MRACSQNLYYSLFSQGVQLLGFEEYIGDTYGGISPSRFSGYRYDTVRSYSQDTVNAGSKGTVFVRVMIDAGLRSLLVTIQDIIQ